MPDPLIEQFVETLATVRGHITARKLDDAHSGYTKLHSLYEQLNQSDVAYHHKRIAFDQVNKVRDQLQRVEEDSIPSSNYAPAIIGVGILFVAAGLLFFMKPSLLGLAVFGEYYSEPVGITFEQSQTYAIVLDAVPTGIALSGQVLDGEAKVYLVDGDTRQLIAEQRAEPGESRTFTTDCQETCTVSHGERTITLDVELTDATLYLDTVDYTGSTQNDAPKYQGTLYEYDVSQSIELNLDTLFLDPNGDRIVYLVTAAEDVTSQLNGPILTLTRTGGTGSRQITIIASDLKEITRVPLTLHLA